MISLFLPLLAVLAGVAAGVLFPARPVAAAVTTAAIPIALFYIFAVHRAGAEIIPHPGLWMLAGMWALCVGAGFLIAKFAFRAP